MDNLCSDVPHFRSPLGASPPYWQEHIPHELKGRILYHPPQHLCTFRDRLHVLSSVRSFAISYVGFPRPLTAWNRPELKPLMRWAAFWPIPAAWLRADWHSPYVSERVGYSVAWLPTLGLHNVERLGLVLQCQSADASGAIPGRSPRRCRAPALGRAAVRQRWPRPGRRPARPVAPCRSLVRERDSPRHPRAGVGRV